MNTQRAKYPIAILSGLALVGGLAGCSTAAESTASTSGGDSGSSAAPQTDAPAGTGGYKDGEYTEKGDYQSPNGNEEVTVTVTLASDVITAVKVVGDGDNPNSKLYQGKFADGIGDVVVGKKIDDIKVDKVAGSSLTSGGFNDAIDAIKADAAS